jgi:Protein of unknown function (DUF3616)
MHAGPSRRTSISALQSNLDCRNRTKEEANLVDSQELKERMVSRYETHRFHLLEFNPEPNKLSKDKALCDGLSVVVQIGNTLWVANDETISLERLSPERRSGEEAHKYGEHTQFPLNDFFNFPCLRRQILKN